MTGVIHVQDFPEYPGHYIGHDGFRYVLVTPEWTDFPIRSGGRTWYDFPERLPGFLKDAMSEIFQSEENAIREYA